ncbi:MAG: fibronectin type III domain-containing protein [Acidobacteria bacterium]|nr:fibronectin type III domain-containing protein [Acidobacteriota bacterium]
MTGAANGDTVQLAADEYNLSGIRVDVTANDLTIQGPGPVGDASTFIPYLMFGGDPGTTSGYRLVFFGANPVLKNLAITGQGTNALVNANPNAQLSLDRVIINYSDPFGGPPSSGIALAGDNATITNSVIRNEAGGSTSRALEATGTLTGSLVYASNGRAISLDGGYHNAGSCTLTVKNTIAWGGGKNLWLEGASPCSTVTINHDYSWIPLSAGAQTGGGLGIGTGITVNNIGSNNLAETPAAVDPTNPGATILPSNSPAINAGCTAGCGTHDYYGRPRPIGSANDIGPYEATLIPEIADGSVSNVTATTAQLSAVVNPNGGETTYNFQIRRAGESDWQTVSGTTLPANTNLRIPVTAEANLLQPETAYQVRVVASNSAGEIATEGLAFRTLATPTPAPSASLTVSSVRVKVGKRGAYFTSRATVNTAGSLAQTATTGSGKKTKTWCKTMTTARAAGTYSLKCNLGSKGRRYLKKRSLALTVKTTLRAATGASATSTRKLTIKRKR